MKRVLSICALLSLLSLPACGTMNTVRWTYGKPSVFDAPDEFSESVGWRAAVGVPVILGGVTFDLATWPLQLLFGVWPMWGDSSSMMNSTTS